MAKLSPQTLHETGIATSHTRSVQRRWVCRVVTGPDSDSRITIGTRPLTIGAGADCDLVLTDPKISRRHADLTATPAGVRIRDLNSTNGTYYQSSRITEAVVAAEATIQVGDSSLRIAAAAASAITPSVRQRFGGMIGASARMREVFAILELASPTEATVLVEGESGTGKELTARALHDHSPRAGSPFVVVDCGATHEQLIDSQLFGHVKGAFTGAMASRKGAFVEAAGGTLFLDELGDLPLASQAKLLRALEARTVVPVGSDRPVSVDARVVAATHKDLHRMVEEKTFRFDLFYRLAVVHLRLPALRERLEDIPPLVRLFYEGRNATPGPMEGENLTRLTRYDWPGNIRELRNVLERAWVLSGSDQAAFSELRLQLGRRPTDGGEVVDTSVPFKEAKELWLEVFERRYLEALYTEHGGNLSSAAAHAGINRNHLRKLLSKYRLLDR